MILPTNASLMLTENCNLACKYCFEKHNTKIMTNEIIRKSLNYLFNNSLNSNKNSVNITLFGGEPLLNIQGVKEALEYGFFLSQINNIPISYSLITNATIMNDEVYKILRTYRDVVNLNIQLSIDGIPDVHNKYRITKTGKPSFPLIEKNIDYFKKIYDYNINDGRLSVHGCITKETLKNVADSYLFFRDILNFKRIWFLAISEEEWSKEDAVEYDKQCDIIFQRYIKDINNSSNKEVEADNYAPFNRYNILNCERNIPCGAGRNFISITSDGDIYPCHQIYFNDEYHDTLLGNVNEGILDEDRRKIFIKYEESDLNCGNCKNTSCYRCLAANWIKNGSMFSQIKGNYCLMSDVERKYQEKIKNMINNNTITKKEEDICLCNSRETMHEMPNNECDIVKNNNFCNSGNNPDNINCLCDTRMCI